MNEIIKLSPDMQERLDRLTSQTGMSREYYLQQFIIEGLEDVEADLAADAIEQRIENGVEKVHSSADVRKALGLDD
jgi:RHH-type rel operon transcriptional repressor/antitoxin RelB